VSYVKLKGLSSSLSGVQGMDLLNCTFSFSNSLLSTMTLNDLELDGTTHLNTLNALFVLFIGKIIDSAALPSRVTEIYGSIIFCFFLPYSALSSGVSGKHSMSK